MTPKARDMATNALKSSKPSLLPIEKIKKPPPRPSPLKSPAY